MGSDRLRAISSSMSTGPGDIALAGDADGRNPLAAVVTPWRFGWISPNAIGASRLHACC
jgi:hypothetical protein